MTSTDPLAAAKPTLSLNPGEWQALAITNANQLSHFLGTIQAPTEAALLEIDGHLIRLRSFLQAWRRSVPAASVAAAAPAQPAEAAPGSNGAAKPKRKGGWPAGKKRTPKPAQPEMQ